MKFPDVYITIEAFVTTTTYVHNKRRGKRRLKESARTLKVFKQELSSSTSYQAIST